MYKIGFYIVLLGFLSACAEEEPEPEPELNWSKIDSSNFGQEVAIQEEIDIKLYLEMHRDWKTTVTGSGLRYYVYKEGDGESPSPDDIAEIEYEITLLDGTECYKTPSTEYEEVVVDRSDVESGVQEALKIMKVGDHAKLIIPSHIGHGVVGDMDKIPPLTTLVIDIHLLGIK